jgi:prevent-host-death family protein
MAERVGIRELRQNLSKYVERVKAGESLVVTERGEPVAQLTPVVDPVYALLAARFGATIPTARLEDIAEQLPPGPSSPPGTADRILADMRREWWER